MDRQVLMRELARDEGRVLKPYRDGVGKLTIGVGRNLDDVGISGDEADVLLANDVDRVVLGLDHTVPWWRDLDEVRQRALANLAFNVGIEGYTPQGKLLTFKNTLRLIQAGDYLGAAQAMLASKWAAQVGPRAVRLAAMMRDGVAPAV